jgi:hypothetical protein
MAILLVEKLYKPGTYRYIQVCTIYTIVYRYIQVHTGTYWYYDNVPLILYHWSGFQMYLMGGLPAGRTSAHLKQT